MEVERNAVQYLHINLLLAKGSALESEWGEAAESLAAASKYLPGLKRAAHSSQIVTVTEVAELTRLVGAALDTVHSHRFPPEVDDARLITQRWVTATGGDTPPGSAE